MPDHTVTSRRTPLAALELIVAIERHGSLSAAARALGMAQPSASTGLKRLERRAGLTLVTRATTGTRLTPAGRALVDRARDVLAASDAFDREVAALRAEHGGRVAVAASLSVAEYLVPGWLASRPGGAALVDLVVANSRDVTDAVLHGRADLGFIEGPDVDPGLEAREVGTDELVVVVAPGHPWERRRRAVTADELSTSALAVREPGSGTRAVLERALISAGHPLRGAPAQVGSTSAVKNVVRGGNAAGVLSVLTVSEELARGTLVRVPVDGVDLRRVLRMVWARGRWPSGAALDLAEHVLRVSSAPVR